MQLLLQHQPKAANNSEVVDLVKQSVDLLNVLQVGLEGFMGKGLGFGISLER